ANERQMWIPAGAAVVPNDQGTAPGFRAHGDGYVLFSLPGPPREMLPMLEAHVLGWLRGERSVEHASSEVRFHLFGISESVFADQVEEWMVRGANPQMGVTFSAGTLTVRVVGWASEQAAADDLVQGRAREFRGRFGAFVYSEIEGDPAVLLVDAARARGLALALAESCTGGLVAARVVSVPGASDVLSEGFVTYSDRAKRERLGVAEELLAEHGAVSREVAEAMARGALQASGADATVAVTGIAGPAGGTPEKPVGLVWFATCVRGVVASQERRFPPVSRTRIQEWASTAALRALTCAIEDAIPEQG
ncbi:MAG: nicotinamide-nucleotide amidase, partial [Chlamydiales bacterium]